MKHLTDENGKPSSSRGALLALLALFLWLVLRAAPIEYVTAVKDLMLGLTGAIGVRSSIKNWRGPRRHQEE